MKVIAFANQKGGVGKTTSAVNVAACLAAAEKKTLLIDLDPQGNATSGLGFSKHSLTLSIYDALIHRVRLPEIILNTELASLDLAPANTQLVGAELELVSVFAREMRLSQALQVVADNYEYILIDCPPSLNLLTINALTASVGIIVPVQCEYYAMEGLSELVKTVQLVQENLNPRLQIEGIVLTMYDARNNLSRQVAQEVRHFFGDKVCHSIIPRNVTLSESPSHGKPVILYDIHSKGAKSYLDLTKELFFISQEKTDPVQSVPMVPAVETEVLLLQNVSL